MNQSAAKSREQGKQIKKRIDLTEGSPGRRLLLFALPMILGNLFQQFYNMADSMIVGNFVGEDALAAVGASYALTNVFIMIAIGGGNGASVLTSQYLGARQHGKMKTSISTALITFLFVSILLGSAGLYLNGLILESLKTSCTWEFTSWECLSCLCTMSLLPYSMPWGIPGRLCTFSYFHPS